MTKKKKKVTPMQKSKMEIKIQKTNIEDMSDKLNDYVDKLKQEKSKSYFFERQHDILNDKHIKLLEDFHTLTMRFLNDPRTMTVHMNRDEKEECQSAIKEWHDGKPHDD